MSITNPMLPPKAGYIEVEANGHRTYRNIKTGVLIEDEMQGTTDPVPTAQDDTDAMLIDHEYRLTLLELGL